MKPKIVLCGCTGAVGRMLVPLLAGSADLILIGRDPATIAGSFPGLVHGSYDQLESLAADADLLVNLAARNNDRPGSLAEFDAVNVNFMLELADRARQAGVGRFVNLSTFHALDGGTRSNYAASKARGDEQLAARFGSDALTLRIAAVHGSELSGKLRIVQHLPRFVRPAVFGVMSALRPTLAAELLAQFIVTEARDWPDQVVELSDDQDKNPVFAAAKRTVDLAFAVGVLAFVWWLMIVIWAAIRIDSRGPGIFAQRRMGRDEREFTCYKFRTMATDTRQSGTHEVSASAVTRLGKWLRRTKLDELPQVLNVFRNELTLVGPRPCLPVQRELIAERRRRGVFAVKPGITGLAQVNDIDMSVPRTLSQWDRRYVMTRSLPQELKLILATFIGRGQGDRVGD